MRVILYLSIILSFISSACAETVYFKNGNSVKGEIIKEEPDALTIKQVINATVTKTFISQRSEILRIEKPSPVVEVKQEAKKQEAPVIKEKPKAPEKPKAAAVEYKVRPRKTEKPPVVQKKVQLPVKAVESKIRQEKGKETSFHAMVRPPRQAKQPAPVYRVVKRRNKDLSWPVGIKRLECDVIAEPWLTPEQVEQFCFDILVAERAGNNPPDALWITVYNKDVGLKGMPRLYAVWTPEGGWDDYRGSLDKSKYRWSYRYCY
jgi:hypothetical protein